MVLAVVVVVIVAIAMLQAVWPSFGELQDDLERDRAVESLRERYARGEIDEAEFERRRAYLEET